MKIVIVMSLLVQVAFAGNNWKGSKSLRILAPTRIEMEHGKASVEGEVFDQIGEDLKNKNWKRNIHYTYRRSTLRERRFFRQYLDR